VNRHWLFYECLSGPLKSTKEYKLEKKELSMLHVMVRVNFEDYEKWKPVFDEAESLRRAYGSRGVRVFRNKEKANEALIFGEYEDLEKVRQLFQSQEFREVAKRAGVSGPPEVIFLEQVDQLPA
jgi:heme-degrading monooxygenase HmoA